MTTQMPPLTEETAPSPWMYQSSGKAGANGDFNLYVVDRDGRKIAAVWGKRGEKQATAAMMIASPDLYRALEEIARIGSIPDQNPEHRRLNRDHMWRIAVGALAKARGAP